MGVQRDRCQSGHYIDAASKAQPRELGKHRESSKQPQPRKRERERKGFDRAPTRGGRKGFERAPTKGGRKRFERDTQGGRGRGGIVSVCALGVRALLISVIGATFGRKPSERVCSTRPLGEVSPVSRAVSHGGLYHCRAGSAGSQVNSGGHQAGGGGEKIL